MKLSHIFAIGFFAVIALLIIWPERPANEVVSVRVLTKARADAQAYPVPAAPFAQKLASGTLTRADYASLTEAIENSAAFKEHHAREKAEEEQRAELSRQARAQFFRTPIVIAAMIVVVTAFVLLLGKFAYEVHTGRREFP